MTKFWLRLGIWSLHHLFPLVDVYAPGGVVEGITFATSERYIAHCGEYESGEARG